MKIDIEIEALAKNILSKQAVGIGLVDRFLHGPKGPAIFVADIDIRFPGAGGVAGDDDPFQDLVRVLLHEDAVIESSRLALVGVDAKVNRPRMILGQEGPLDAARKPRAAPPAQSRFLDDFDDFLGRHIVDGFGQGPVATVGAVAVQ